MRRHLEAPDLHVQLPTPVRSVTAFAVTPIIAPRTTMQKSDCAQQRLERQPISLKETPPVDHCWITTPGYPQDPQGIAQIQKLRRTIRTPRPVDEPVETVDSRTLLL